MDDLSNSALRVVLDVRETEQALKMKKHCEKMSAKLDILKSIYPTHFLTDDDINNGETGVFDIEFVVDGIHGLSIRDARIVFMGKTDDGRFKWKPTDPHYDDWGSGAIIDGFQTMEFEEDEEGNRLVNEEQMKQWNATLCPCGSNNANCGYYKCCICGIDDDDYPEVVELDDIPEGQICHDKNGTEIKVGDTVKIRYEHLGTDREFTVAYIIYIGFEDREYAEHFDEPGFLLDDEQQTGYVNAGSCVKL